MVLVKDLTLGKHYKIIDWENKDNQTYSPFLVGVLVKDESSEDIYFETLYNKRKVAYNDSNPETILPCNLEEICLEELLTSHSKDIHNIQKLLEKTHLSQSKPKCTQNKSKINPHYSMDGFEINSTCIDYLSNITYKKEEDNFHDYCINCAERLTGVGGEACKDCEHNDSSALL